MLILITAMLIAAAFSAAYAAKWMKNPTDEAITFSAVSGLIACVFAAFAGIAHNIPYSDGIRKDELVSICKTQPQCDVVALAKAIGYAK